MSNGYVKMSPKAQKRAREFRKRQEKRWAKKSGPVTVRQMTPEEIAAFDARRAAREPSTTA